MPRYEGRLELTWTNKHERLLAHDDGSYEWLPPSDYRVAEVRLLDDVETVGDVGRRRAADNLLIRGDALHALTSLTKLPEFAGEYVGKVKLAYLDPPFNTGQAFEQYDDALEHSVWLTMMRDRLTQIRELLTPDGSVWVHCDDSEQHRLRCVMDEVFGSGAFVATVVWQKRYSRDNRPAIGAVHDYLHVYAPLGTDWKLVRNRVERDTRAHANIGMPTTTLGVRGDLSRSTSKPGMPQLPSSTTSRRRAGRSDGHHQAGPGASPRIVLMGWWRRAGCTSGPTDWGCPTSSVT